MLEVITMNPKTFRVAQIMQAAIDEAGKDEQIRNDSKEIYQAIRAVLTPTNGKVTVAAVLTALLITAHAVIEDNCRACGRCDATEGVWGCAH